MSFEGGAFNFVKGIESATSDFNSGKETEGTRFGETTAYLGQTDRRLADDVAAQRSVEHGHPGVEGVRGGPEHLSAAERSPGTTLERSEANAAEHRTEMAELSDEIDFFMDPMPSGAERAPETATA